MIGIGCSFRNVNQKLGVFSPRRTGNAMAAPDRFIAWCKQEQASIEQQLELMDKGKVRTGQDTGVGWVDTTSESMERARARLADLKSLLTESGSTIVSKSDAALFTQSSDIRRACACMFRPYFPL